MTSTEAPGIFEDLVEEVIPPLPKRPPGKGREPVKWESHLAPLEERLLNKPHRLWSYANKTGATSRMGSVRSRLMDAAPNKNWELKVRPVPGTDPQLFGVYAVFHGEYTPEQMTANAQARQARRNAIAQATAARAAQSGENSNGAEPKPAVAASPPQTAKEKLAAAAAAKK